MRKYLLALPLLLLSHLALAQALVVHSYSVTVGTTSAACVSPNASMLALYIENTGGTNNIFFDYPPTAAAVATSSELSASGTSTINGWKWWPLNTAPKNGLNCIASGGSSTMFIAIYTAQ